MAGATAELHEASILAKTDWPALWLYVADEQLAIAEEARRHLDATPTDLLRWGR